MFDWVLNMSLLIGELGAKNEHICTLFKNRSKFSSQLLLTWYGAFLIQGKRFWWNFIYTLMFLIYHLCPLTPVTVRGRMQRSCRPVWLRQLEMKEIFWIQLSTMYRKIWDLNTVYYRMRNIYQYCGLITLTLSSLWVVFE